MTTTVNVYEATTHLSRLLDDVEHGEDVVVARSGRPVARLVRYGEPSRRVRLGVLAGRLVVPDDFDADDELIADLFEGRTAPDVA